jgi:hypothetical protein
MEKSKLWNHGSAVGTSLSRDFLTGNLSDKYDWLRTPAPAKNRFAKTLHALKTVNEKYNNTKLQTLEEAYCTDNRNFIFFYSICDGYTLLASPFFILIICLCCSSAGACSGSTSNSRKLSDFFSFLFSSRLNDTRAFQTGKVKGNHKPRCLERDYTVRSMPCSRSVVAPLFIHRVPQKANPLLKNLLAVA